MHSIAELLRYTLFILIPAGIIQVRRRTQKERVRPTMALVKYLLSIVVFTINLPAALVIFCYTFVPILGIFLFSISQLRQTLYGKRLFLCYVSCPVFHNWLTYIYGDFTTSVVKNINRCILLYPTISLLYWLVTIVHYLVNRE